MPTCEVFCLQGRCKGLRYGFVEEGNGAILALLTIAVHTTPPHGAAHPLAIKMDGQDLPTGNHVLTCKCINGTCSREREITYNIPMELTAACAIAFHAIHEGHPMELWLDGKKIHPPEK